MKRIDLMRNENNRIKDNIMEPNVQIKQLEYKIRTHDTSINELINQARMRDPFQK